MEMKHLLKWNVIEPAYYWARHNLYVLADRHLPNGRRQHIVKGKIKPNTVLDNADIFGEDI